MRDIKRARARPPRRSCTSTPIRTRSWSTARSCGCSTATRPPTATRTRSRSTRAMPAGSGLDTDFNYVRNSVKATVDAYDGTSSSTSSTRSDPIIRTYRKAFPDLFDDVEGHAGRTARALALPRGPVRRADRAVHAVPHDRPEQFFQQAVRCGTSRRAPTARRRTTAATSADAGAATTAAATRRSQSVGQRRSSRCT